MKCIVEVNSMRICISITVLKSKALALFHVFVTVTIEFEKEVTLTYFSTIGHEHTFNSKSSADKVWWRKVLQYIGYDQVKY